MAYADSHKLIPTPVSVPIDAGARRPRRAVVACLASAAAMHVIAIPVSLYVFKLIAESAAGRPISWELLFAAAATELIVLLLFVAGISAQAGFATIAGFSAIFLRKPERIGMVPQIVVGAVALVFSLAVFGGLTGAIGGALSIAGGAVGRFRGIPSAIPPVPPSYPAPTPGEPQGLVGPAPVRTKQWAIPIVIAVVAAVVVGATLTTFLTFSPPSWQINLSEADMPGWTLAFDGQAISDAPGLLDSSGRTFTGAGGIIFGSQVIRFDSDAHARQYVDGVEQQWRSSGYSLQKPSSPPVGTVSIYVVSLNVLMFQKNKVVVSMQFSISGSGSFTQSDLMDLAFIVESRIP